MSNTLVVGSLAFDDLDMPSGNFRDVLGGAATYSSIAASMLAPVRLVGVVGGDFDEKHLDMLRSRGVDTGGVERQAGKTFRWHGRYSQDLASRESIDTQLNVFADFRPRIPEGYKRSEVVLLGNIHPKLQLEVLAQVERGPHTMVIADTMNFWISGEPKALTEMLPKVDLFVINDEEARQLAGKDNVSLAAREIRKMGPKRLIIKRGEHGAALFDDHGVFFVPGYPLEEVLDPTGAGDTFAGGLAGYIASQKEQNLHTVRRGMFYASALGSFCVEGIGPKRLLEVDKAQLQTRLDAFARMVDYGGSLR
ncbi:MAG TPA: PfkB family carbohydrate kinase [Polyangiaceae bacterium]|jgi:sugar/nucleoside kinase (ribokinase family)